MTLSLITTGCSDDAVSDSESGQNQNTKADSNTEVNTKDPLGTVKTPEPKQEIEAAETLKPVVNAYCTAIINGDDTALRNVFSRAAWKSLSADARSEGKNSVAKYLAASEPIGDTCNVINERIVGNTAEATVITQTYPNGVPLKFIKENGSWKWTTQSSDFEAVKKGNNK